MQYSKSTVRVKNSLKKKKKKFPACLPLPLLVLRDESQVSQDSSPKRILLPASSEAASREGRW